MSSYFDFTEAWKVNDPSERVRLAGIFLDARKQADYQRLAQDYPGLFGYESYCQSSEDVRSVCELMRTAEAIHALRKTEKKVELDDMQRCGLSPSFAGWGSVDAPGDEIDPDTYALSFFYKPAGSEYLAWLGRSAQKVAARFPQLPSFAMQMSGDGTLFYRADSRSINEFERRQDDFANILQQLVTLHLADVATVCDGTEASPYQVAYSGISALWLGLSERMSAGRAFRCEACGKPTVAYGERRTKHYCCPACRKWANAHPGEKRLSWYIEKR